MYICAVTGKSSRLGEKMNRVVINTRQKVYTEWVREDGEWVEFEIGHGFETVKEVQVSDEGLRLYNAMNNEEYNSFVSQL